MRRRRGYNPRRCPSCVGVGVGIDRDPAKICQATKLYGRLDHLRFVRDDAAARLAALPPSSVDVCLSIFGAFSFTPGAHY